MKKQMLSFAAGLSVLLAGCGDGNDPESGGDGGKPVGDVRLITRVEIDETAEYRTVHEVFSFAYDAENRLVTLRQQTVWTSTDGDTRNYGHTATLDYSTPNTIVCRFTGSDDMEVDPLDERTTAHLDADGRMTDYEWNGSDDFGASTSVTSKLTYRDGRLVSVQDNAGIKQVSQLTWKDGNLVAVTYGDKTDAATYDGRANDKTNLDLNWLLYNVEYFCCLLANDDFGVLFPMTDRLGARSAGYLKTVRPSYSEYTDSYDYTFDAEGYPTRVVQTRDWGPAEQQPDKRIFTITYNR